MECFKTFHLKWLSIPNTVQGMECFVVPYGMGFS